MNFLKYEKNWSWLTRFPSPRCSHTKIYLFFKKNSDFYAFIIEALMHHIFQDGNPARYNHIGSTPYTIRPILKQLKGVSWVEHFAYFFFSVFKGPILCSDLKTTRNLMTLIIAIPKSLLFNTNGTLLA